MSWLCETLSFYQSSRTAATRTLWVNFDTFLRQPARGLQAIFQALGADSTVGDLEALVTGPIMHRYSKAPQYAYDSNLRRELLQQAELNNPAEIKRGMQWLNLVARRYPQAQAVIESATHRRGI